MVWVLGSRYTTGSASSQVGRVLGMYRVCRDRWSGVWSSTPDGSTQFLECLGGFRPIFNPGAKGGLAEGRTCEFEGGSWLRLDPIAWNVLSPATAPGRYSP